MIFRSLRGQKYRGTGIIGTDAEGIESVGAVGAVFEQVLLGLRKFLAGLVFAEAVAPETYPCRLYGENQVLVV